MQLKQYVRNWVCQAPNVGMFFFWWDKSLLNCQFVWISFNKKLRGTSQMHFISMNSSMRLSCPDTFTGTSWCIQVQALNSECYSALNIKGALIGTSWCTSLTQKLIIKWQQRSERRWETDQETEVKFYLLHAHAASLRGVSDKRRLLGEGGAVAVTAVYLKDQKNSRESNISSQTSLNIYQIFNCLMFHSTECLLPCRCTGSEVQGRTSWSGWWCSLSWRGSAGGRPGGAPWVEPPSRGGTATGCPCSSPCWPAQRERGGVKLFKDLI